MLPGSFPSLVFHLRLKMLDWASLSEAYFLSSTKRSLYHFQQLGRKLLYTSDIIACVVFPISVMYSQSDPPAQNTSSH